MKQFGRTIIARLMSLFIAAMLIATSIASTANARFISPDDWDPIKPGVGTNRYAYSENDPINKSDPNGHAVEKDAGPLGVASHKHLEDTSIANGWTPERPIKDSIFSLLGFSPERRDWRPDATKENERSITVFDYKPISHIYSSDLTKADLQQQQNWKSYAEANGLDLNLASTEELKDQFDKVDQGFMEFKGNLYNITTYTGSIPGIVYYDSKRMDKQKNSQASEKSGAFIPPRVGILMEALRRYVDSPPVTRPPVAAPLPPLMPPAIP